MKKIINLLLCLLLAASLMLSAAAQTEPAAVSDDAQTSNGGAMEAPPESNPELPPESSEESGSSEEIHQHSWDAGTVTTAPTCTESGIRTYACACGATSTETLKATGHAYGEWFQGKSTHERTCTACGKAESGEHSMSTKVTAKPTCKDKGVETSSCGVCGYSYTKELPVSSEHTYGEWDGSETHHFRSCTVCGTEESGSHSWADELVTVKPTCKEEGATAQVCTICGGAIIEILPKLTTHTYDNVCDPECNICGHTREAEHKFSAGWYHNFSDHWHGCIRCGEKKDVADHYPGPAATEEKDQICLTCGYVMTPKLGHVHEYSEEWSSDAQGHWYGCEGCGEQEDYGEHVYDNLCDPDCNICDYLAPAAHQFDEEWSSDEAGHWTACILCGKENTPEPHIPDEAASAGGAVLCTVCGYEITPAAEHIHKGSSPWNRDEAGHWRTCDCGEITDNASHSWGSGVENVDATITYRCTECGAERTEGEPKPLEEESGFPYGLLLSILAFIAVGLIVALICILRPGKRSAGKYHKK